ncbi:MAG: amino acid--tRNA ligase-related protein, partial [Chloroflexota bacterium]|nr:amino acid--tRNA ligase-related protein [Chloroflexota bacterium]
MAQNITVSQIGQYIGQEVTLRGWVYDRTDKGKLQFIMLRDGSGLVQCVAYGPGMDAETFALAGKLTQESSVIITGTVKTNDKAKKSIPAGYEVDVKTIQLVQMVEDYPITPKEHGIEFLMDNRHLWLRSQRQWAILRIRATITRALTDWLDDHGYLRVDTPIITPAAGEETTTLFEIDYHGDPAFLAQTGQLYNEANMMA